MKLDSSTQETKTLKRISPEFAACEKVRQMAFQQVLKCFPEMKAVQKSPELFEAIPIDNGCYKLKPIIQ